MYLPWSQLTNLSEEHSLSFSPEFSKFECNTTPDWLNQKLCYIQMMLDIEKSGEQDKKRCEEWLVNTDPDLSISFWTK